MGIHKEDIFKLQFFFSENVDFWCLASKLHNNNSATASFDICSTSAPGCTKISALVLHNLKILLNWYVSEIKKIYPHQKDIGFPVLIGKDHADLLLHRDFNQGQNRTGTGLLSEKTEALYAELNERAEAATSGCFAEVDFLQYIYSELVVKNH